MTALARPQPAKEREFYFPSFERQTLANGFSVVVASMHRLPVITAILLVDGGAMREAPGLEGVADITARALLEGTEPKSADELVQALERLGTSLSALSDWDSSILKMTVMSPNIVGALTLMSEAVIHPGFAANAIERIRSERLSEISQTKSEPRLLADEMFSSFVYDQSSRYAVPLGGTEQSVGRVGAQEVRDYYSTTYNPRSATLILAGDIDGDKARGLADKLFGNWSGSAVQAQDSVTSASVSRTLHVVERAGAQQSELRIGHVGAARSEPDYFRIVVMNAVLGGLFSSRINLNLREVHGYTYGASSYFDWRRGKGPFLISTAVQSEVTGAAIREVLSEADRIQREEISDEELTLATSYLAGVFPIRYETTDAVASGLASLVVFDLPDNYFTAYRDNILAVTPGEVLHAAQRHLRREELSIVVVGNPQLLEPQLIELNLGPVKIHTSAQ